MEIAVGFLMKSTLDVRVSFRRYVGYRLRGVLLVCALTCTTFPFCTLVYDFTCTVFGR